MERPPSLDYIHIYYTPFPKKTQVLIKEISGLTFGIKLAFFPKKQKKPLYN